MSDAGANLWVFRDGRRTVCGDALTRRVAADLRNLCDSRDAVVSALISAGELESALADANHPNSPLASQLSEALATQLLAPSSSQPELLPILQRIHPPDTLPLSTAEGFAYYGLHPLDFVAAAESICASHAAVAGIRSIGAPLSAVVAAELAKRGVQVARTTVRPHGHVFNRETAWTCEQRRWIEEHLRRGAEFVVVDEGPGLSGSSFLSVGEALIGAGVPRHKITFLCSRTPNPDYLVADNAAERWRSFRSVAADTHVCLPPHREDLSGGRWRQRWFGGRDAPASWISMERMKFLSRDGKSLYKFCGLGRFGAAVLERERALASFVVGAEEACDGFARYPIASFSPLAAHDLTPAMAMWIGEYCAFRRAALPADDTPREPLEAMTRFNVRQLLGLEIDFPDGVLATDHPIIADGRMLPHEWVRSDSGVKKTDSCTHGDDHFFPGPVDVAWDLAGAIVEWTMDENATDALVNAYRAKSGDDPRPRLPAFLLAYSIFRAAYCAMAAHAMQGTVEEPLLRRDASRYGDTAAQYARNFSGLAHRVAG